MARYWVGDTGERRAPATDPSSVPDGIPQQRTTTQRRERVSEAVRRSLAANLTPDDPRD